MLFSFETGSHYVAQVGLKYFVLQLLVCTVCHTLLSRGCGERGGREGGEQERKNE